MHVKYRLYNKKFFSSYNKLFQILFSCDPGISSGINELLSLYSLSKVASEMPVCTTFFLKEAVTFVTEIFYCISTSHCFLAVGLI